jgi:hypothetical protein
MRFPSASEKPPDVLSRMWPVGSVYVSADAANPADKFGMGVWAAFGEGRVLVGFDATQTEFDALLETGGAKTVTLTEAQMPAHTHTLPVGATDDTSAPFDRADAGTNAAGANATTTTGTTGGGAHPNLPPYIVVRFWRRTA